MSLISTRIVNPMQQIMQKELATFISKNSERKVAQMFAPDPTGNDVCIRVLPKTSSFQTLLKVSRLTHIDTANEAMTDISPLHYNKLFKTITKSIINIANAGNFYACISKINAIKESLGPLFYGALLLDGEVMINPLHPLVAMRMLSKNSATSSSRNYRLAVFTYESPEKYSEVYSFYRESKVDINKVTANINSQIQCYASTVADEIEISSVNATGSDSQNINIEYRLRKHQDEEQDYEYYLSAHQVLTEGIAMPYYGSSIIMLSASRSTSGISVSPMRSCNIASISEDTNTYVNTTTPIEKVRVNFNSVCTGNENNKTLKGIRTLTHSNASSPYTNEIIAIGAITYAAECVNKSLQIYDQANLLKEQ